MVLSLSCALGNKSAERLVGIWEGVVFEAGKCPDHFLLAKLCGDVKLSVGKLGCDVEDSWSFSEDECFRPRLDAIAGYALKHLCGEDLGPDSNPDLLTYLHYPAPSRNSNSAEIYCLKTYQLQFTKKTVFLDNTTFLYEIIESGDNYIVLAISGGAGGAKSRNLFVSFKEGETGIRYLALDDGRQFMLNPELTAQAGL